MADRQGLTYISIRAFLTSATNPGSGKITTTDPMVTSYAENIKNNVESLTDHKVHFRNPLWHLQMRKS